MASWEDKMRYLDQESNEREEGLEEKDFVIEAGFEGGQFNIDLLDFHRRNKGAIQELRRSSPTALGDLRNATMNGATAHHHSRFFPTHLGNMMLALIEQRLDDETHPWTRLAFVMKDDATASRKPDFHAVDLGERGRIEVGLEAELHIDVGEHNVMLVMTHDHDGDRRFHVGVPEEHAAAADAFLEQLSKDVFDELLRGLLLTSTYRVLDRSTMRDERLTVSDDIAEAIQREITDYIPLMGELEAMGVPSSRGVILAGEPGTGKTLIVKHIVSASENLSTILVSPDELGRGSIRRIFEHARMMSPCLVVLEDIDNVGAISRDIAQHPILGELLVAMDGTDGNSGVVVIATTNHIGFLDGAIRSRPGRFDRVIHVGAPSTSVRRTMLKEQVRRFGAAPKDLDMNRLVRDTDGMTGAYLNEVVKSAFIRCRQRGATVLGDDDLAHALADVKGSRSLATDGPRGDSMEMGQNGLFA